MFNQYRMPFLVNEKGKVALNDRAVAVKCATKHLVKYNPGSKSYERYDGERGLWVLIHEIEVMRMLDNLLVELAETYGHQEVVKRITAAKLGSLCRMLKPHDVKLKSENTAGLEHVRNKVVALVNRKMLHTIRALRHLRIPRASLVKFVATNAGGLQ